MEHLDVNWLAVIVSAIASFVIGALWYGPLFGKSWMATVGMTEEDIKNSNMTKTYGTSFVLILVMMFGLAVFLSVIPAGDVDAYQGGVHGLMIGLLFVAPSMGINYLYEGKPFKLWIINVGYQVLYLTIAGVILGAWR